MMRDLATRVAVRVGWAVLLFVLVPVLLFGTCFLAIGLGMSFPQPLAMLAVLVIVGAPVAAVVWVLALAATRLVREPRKETSRRPRSGIIWALVSAACAAAFLWLMAESGSPSADAWFFAVAFGIPAVCAGFVAWQSWRRPSSDP